MSILHATTHSSTLDLRDLANRSSWSLLSQHHRACNLLADDGTVVALVSEVYGNGPFHILIPRARFDPFERQVSVTWHARQLQVGPVTVDLQKSRPWNPRLPLITSATSRNDLLTRLPAIQTRSPLYAGGSALTARAQNGIAQLQSGLANQDDRLLTQGVLQLAGLGPGLTPAGDDFLVGLLAALTACCSPAGTAEEQCRRIASVATPRTTRLSAAWLYRAGEGYFGELWHRLTAAANAGDQAKIAQAVNAIGATGATSGADALYGFLVGLHVGENRELRE